MGKNIALFVDGTGNNGRRDELAHEETNVWRLHEACRDEFKRYLPGVGTRRLDLLGGATGFGTKKRLVEAYSFLIEHYSEGDNIFLFGFSRGALAVRLLAGFVGYVGTIFGRPELRDYLPSVYRFYTDAVLLGAHDRFREYIRNFDEVAPLPIHFLGVWDTVEEYLRADLPELKSLPRHISHARQALALHERRGEMEPTLIEKWDESKSTVKQVWFPGAHADVGGGYAAAKLAEAPLEWMRGEAVGLGLDVEVLKKSEDAAVLHQQRTGDRLTHPLIQRRYGEATRSVLAKYPAVGKQLLGSMSVDASAYAYVLSVVEPQFDGPSWERGKDEARAGLHDVDEKTLAMILGIRTVARVWPREVKLEDARECEVVVRQFFATPNPAGVESCADALALFVVLKGDEGKLGSTGESDDVRQALEQCEAKLAGTGVGLPVGLNEVLGELRARRRIAVEEAQGRLAEEARSWRIQLKKKT